MVTRLKSDVNLTSSVAGIADWHNVKRLFVIRTQNFFDVVVIKGANSHRAKLKASCLETDILSGVSRFDMNVSDAPLTIFSRHPFVDRRDDDIDGALANMIPDRPAALDKAFLWSPSSTLTSACGFGWYL